MLFRMLAALTNGRWLPARTLTRPRTTSTPTDATDPNAIYVPGVIAPASTPGTGGAVGPWGEPLPTRNPR